MKKLISAILILSLPSLLISQLQTVDTELLSNLVASKQDEVKKRFLRNLVSSNIKTSNYITYNCAFNIVDIVTTEKNKTVMARNLFTQVAEYSILFALANKYVNSGRKEIEIIEKSNSDVQTIQLLLFDRVIEKKLIKGNKFKNKSTTLSGQMISCAMDSIYKELKTNAYFNEKGLFKYQSWRTEVSKGLNLDYETLLEKDKKEAIGAGVRDYIEEITTKLSSGSNQSDELMKLLSFNGYDFNNLKLLKREEVSLIKDMFSYAIESMHNKIAEVGIIRKLTQILNTYLIIDLRENNHELVYNFRLDVEALILTLEQSFSASANSKVKKSFVGIQPFFGIGANYGYLDNPLDLDSSSGFEEDNISQLAFASEKFGLKFIFSDLGYYFSNKPNEPFMNKGKKHELEKARKDPLVHNIYGYIYGSGLLYNIADLKSENNFDYALIGAGMGIEFFNGLEANIFYSFPLIRGRDIKSNPILGLGFDIPVFEYIRESRNRKR